MKAYDNLVLQTREDTAAVLLDIVRPLKSMYSPGCARLQVGSTAAHYGEKAAGMEGFSRVLWGLGPLWAGDNRGLTKQLQIECRDWLALYQEGIIHGTDPEHEEYWGHVADYDQKMVEMAAIVTAISLSPDKLWEPFDKRQKENLYLWLDQINHKKVHPNNWRFFRILVNMTFRLLGLPWSEVCTEDDFAVIEGSYDCEGWYHDGKTDQVDYYIPFAMHFYGLIYAHFMEKEDPKRVLRLKERAEEFSKTFPYWFGNDGNEIPFGRSLTYRFAHGAYFSAMGFAGLSGPGAGKMKKLALRNLEGWLKRPIFDKAGVLTIGYGYSNLFMSERYNAPGSPYWGLKTFLMLALPERHPFWADEGKTIEYEAQKLIGPPHMLVTHDENNHVMAYTAGQHAKNHGASQEKYEKFVYSNQFGFSVSRGYGLEEGAFDCTLAVSPAGEGRYQMRYGTEEYLVTEEYVYAKYQITPKTVIESTIIPCTPWHVRVHRILAEEEIDIADGGFSIEAERCFTVASGGATGKYEAEMVHSAENSVSAVFPWGISTVVSYTGGKGTLVVAYPNTNLLYNLTVIPMIEQRLGKGEHLIITAVMADRSEQAAEWLLHPPTVSQEEGAVVVVHGGKMIFLPLGRPKQQLKIRT